MDEKRRSRRVPFNSKISIESLFRSGEQEPIKINADIIITNISKTGIGFISEVDLPVNHFFNSKIVIDDERMFYCVLKIVRNKKINKGYQIGAEFVGLAEVLGHHIDDYIGEFDE
ncbi:MAG: hypothetical protein PWR27_1406 [Petroclostridium sp.]|uniref:PilZ domain-containing protein n=1 Tax=Petroclostridium xylanilyticum TaxID=1792311 RepID=UPI0012FFB7CD|nr:PilZ domain-containing protein [Petroclostridium xylanilyticum]MBZ4645458.1 hypothetical protein [Clostridia bacterium]MDK2810697.1 hypothetical protein [Petroclostridium sp.]